jgi:hypothetical protein
MGEKVAKKWGGCELQYNSQKSRPQNAIEIQL